MTFDPQVLNLSPEMFPGPLGASLSVHGLGIGTIVMTYKENNLAGVLWLQIENWTV